MLASMPPLVEAASLDKLRTALAAVAKGRAHVVQAGDCAEDFAECTAHHVARKVQLLDVLAAVMTSITGRPVVRVGRIGGQFAKPRSALIERVTSFDVPVYRGHMVNDPAPDPDARRPDPRRLLAGYRAASRVMAHLGPTPQARVEPRVWTSHEALLMDYEVPMLRRDRTGQLALTSTHWPWIGDRTRQVDGAHVQLLVDVANPVACKVGPQMEIDELVALCARLDPAREPGRLTLIARIGAEATSDLLPPLVSAVRRAGHPVIWLVDPMHANTIATCDGRKTRLVDTLVREVAAFQTAVRSAGGIPGGLHLEATPDDVTECVDAAPYGVGAERIDQKYTTLCDPRLNPGQAVSVVSTWHGQAMNSTAEKPLPRLAPISEYALPSPAELPTNIARWSIEPRRAVLLVHDMQRYFVAPLPASVRDPVVRHCATLREKCAIRDVPVFFTAQPGGMTQQQRGLLKDFWGPGMRVDPLDRQIVDELAPRPVDQVLTKWRYSAFFRSDLLAQMRKLGRDQLIICGVYAHVGVLMTAVEAFTNDIQSFLVADAVGDFSAREHRMALDYAAGRCSVVTTTEEVFR